MNPSLEERKFRYIETLQTEQLPAETSWWQNRSPSYHQTGEYASGYPGLPVVNDEPVIYKMPVREKLVVAVLFIVAAILLILLSKNEFFFGNVIFLLILLIGILPWLLNSKSLIRISRDGIWLYKEKRGIRWENMVITFIKEVHGEEAGYFFVVHYYNEALDVFQVSEVKLDGLVAPADFSATLEAFRKQDPGI